MDFKNFDDIEIPEELNNYINKGMKKGMDYEKNAKKRIWDYKRIGKIVASIMLIGGISLTTAANIPVVAKELVNIPLIGNIVKKLDFRNGINTGGEITDGTNIKVGTLENNTAKIYFKTNDDIIANVPAYNVEYREYPYTLVFEFNGVRGFDVKEVEKELRKLPLVSDCYRIVTLDDSAIRLAVEFSKDVDVNVSEYKEPGMIEVTVNKKESEKATTRAYFVRSTALQDGELPASLEESAQEFGKASMQKDSKGTFVVQFGPFDSKEMAEKQLNIVKDKFNDSTNWNIEERNLGKKPN